MRQKRTDPIKGEPEPEAELTGEEPARQPEESGIAEEAELTVESAVENAAEEAEEAEEAVKADSLQHISESEGLTKECVDRLAEEKGAEQALAELEKCRLVKLRNLARKYDGLQIAGREISKANKATLLEELKKYYNKDN
jgi:hypothetical protein